VSARPACRLYLAVPAGPAPAALDAAAAGGDLAALLVRGGEARDLAAVCRRRGIALMLEDRAAALAAEGADGVHLTDPKAYDAARRLLGAGRTIGVACGGSRDAAMTVAERGADYVLLEGVELLAWWAELMEVPCVGRLAAGADPAPLVRAGADFLLVEDAAPSAERVRELNRAIAACARA